MWTPEPYSTLFWDPTYLGSPKSDSSAKSAPLLGTVTTMRLAANQNAKQCQIRGRHRGDEGRQSLWGRIIHEVKMERCEIQRGSYSRKARRRLMRSARYYCCWSHVQSDISDWRRDFGNNFLHEFSNFSGRRAVQVHLCSRSRTAHTKFLNLFVYQKCGGLERAQSLLPFKKTQKWIDQLCWHEMSFY